MAIIPINFDEFVSGSVTPTGYYDSTSNLNIGAKTSPFIVVKPSIVYTIQFIYDLNKLTGVSNSWAWGRVFAYDSNFEPIVQLGVYNEGMSSKIHEINTLISNNVRYIRLSASHILNDAVSVTINYNEPTLENEKTILKLHANGDFETIDTDVVQSQINSNYLFSNNLIIVPKIIEMSDDITNPISFSNEGIKIKGNLIYTEIEPENNVIFSDNFNRVNSNDLGENWIVARGGWAIENNMVKPTTTNNLLFCTHSHSDNVSISADVIRNLSEGIIIRGRDATNHLYVQFEQQYLRIKTVINGTVSTLASFNLNSVTNVVYRARIEIRGIEVKVFINDVLCITHETSAFLNEYLSGFQSWTDNESIGRFDNFEITKLTD